MGTANAAIVEQLIADMNAGNGPAYMEKLADDIRYTVIGSTPLSGTCEGRDELLQKIVMPLMEQLEGFVKITPRVIFGEGDMVCVQAQGEARTKTGRDYNNTYCFVFRFRGDKIAQVTEYLDTDLLRRVFA